MAATKDTNGVPDARMRQAPLGSLHRTFRELQWLAEGVAKTAIVGLMLCSMIWAVKQVDPGNRAQFADRIFAWGFAVFTVGVVELFALFVLLAVLGKIDLSQAFYDKDETSPDAAPNPASLPEAGSKAPGSPNPLAQKRQPSVSLARLQAFMWTLIVMIVYFHQAVSNQQSTLPSLPPELLMVMGISGAVYLASKGISTAKAAKPPEPPEPGGPVVTPKRDNLEGADPKAQPRAEA
jgi:hypothetical protein